MKPIELAGKTFGRWTVIARAPDRGDYVVRWVCRCGCEAEREIASASLRNGLSVQCKSCAQMSRRSMIEARATRKVWHGMKERCENPKNPKFYRYGARGIAVCERWQKFEKFFADMGHRPSRQHTVERKNNDGNYEPGNVVWALAEEQANNRSTNLRIEIGGVTRTLAQWCRQHGMSMGLVSARIKRGWSPIRALTEAPCKPGGDMRDRWSA